MVTPKYSRTGDQNDDCTTTTNNNDDDNNNITIRGVKRRKRLKKAGNAPARALLPDAVTHIFRTEEKGESTHASIRDIYIQHLQEKCFFSLERRFCWTTEENANKIHLSISRTRRASRLNVQSQTRFLSPTRRTLASFRTLF